MTKWSWFPCRHNPWLMRWQPHSSLASYPVSCGELWPSSALPGPIFLISLPSSYSHSQMLTSRSYNSLPPSRARTILIITIKHLTTQIYNISNTNFKKLIIHINDQLIEYAKAQQFNRDFKFLRLSLAKSVQTMFNVSIDKNVNPINPMN